MTVSFDDLKVGTDGLVPAVVQDAMDGTVLMVGYMSRQAFDATLETGFVHFWSRSRSELWKKGEMSGNTLSLESMSTDCDADTLLVTAMPAGPTCHTGSKSCFGDDRASLGSIIDELVGVIAERRSAPPDESYTARLLSDPGFAARKVLEEAGEVAFAAKDLESGSDTPAHVAEEAADVVYHLLALVASVGVDTRAVAGELRRRRR